MMMILAKIVIVMVLNFEFFMHFRGMYLNY